MKICCRTNAFPYVKGILKLGNWKNYEIGKRNPDKKCKYYKRNY